MTRLSDETPHQIILGTFDVLDDAHKMAKALSIEHREKIYIVKNRREKVFYVENQYDLLTTNEVLLGYYNTRGHWWRCL